MPRPASSAAAKRSRWCGRLATLLAAALLAGCSGDDGPAMPLECISGSGDVKRALERAPGEVRLEHGTLLSECVARAESDGELQDLGVVLTDVAEDLEASAASAPQAALQLGYLVGAARRGAPSESSLQAELVHRLERSAAISLSTASEAALADGLRAGEARG